MKRTTLFFYPLMALATLSLSGCIAPLVMGASVGAAGTAVVYDRRSLDTIKMDQTIDYNIENALYADDAPTKAGHIGAFAYDHTVLLVGQAPDATAQQFAETTAKKTDHVTRVYNEITVGPNTSATTRATDSWITTKVKAALLAEKNLKSGQFKIATEDSVVFILGKASNVQARLAASIASKITGVTRVVKIITPLPASAPAPTAKTPAKPKQPTETEQEPAIS